MDIPRLRYHIRAIPYAKEIPGDETVLDHMVEIKTTYWKEKYPHGSGELGVDPVAYIKFMEYGERN